ncbi:MAG: hypothetical protein LAN71_16970 [Acidobacteriia bacterium]|nr:hypothetical protein [Terriglobia bacterium]
MTKESEALKLLESVESELINKFKQLRELHYNPNTKGYSYEKALKDFLELYLGGIYDFHVRVPIIDCKLESYSVFSSGENEFDVVGTYKTAVPKIVFKAQETSFVPYDAVSFLLEVKQTLNNEVLENDLRKLNKLNRLPLGNRFGVTIGGKYNIQRPLKALFYYESEISDKTLLSTLDKYGNAWDLTIVLDDNTLLANPQLPLIQATHTSEIAISKRYPLLQSMFIITTSLPYPPIVSAWSLFVNLLRPET